MLALEFPPINEVIRWKDIFPTFNKVAFIACLASLIGIAIFLPPSRRDPLVAPTGRSQRGRDGGRVHRGTDRDADDGA